MFIVLLALSSVCFSQVVTKNIKPTDFNKLVKSRIKAESAYTFLPTLNKEELI
jgi:hypothetical protein